MELATIAGHLHCLMSDDSFLYSRFAQWARTHSAAGTPRDSIRADGLKLLVDCVDKGEIASLDSYGSPVSRAIMALHGATVFEMNSNWAASPQDWRCPCCERSKLQISRVGQHGQILAKSVVHHDHMNEVLRQAFNAAFITAGTTIEQVDGLELVRRMRSAFAAYDEILVCEDCNNADASAKRLANLPKDFSFSIGQIRTFITIRDHQPHELDLVEIMQAWGAAEKAFMLRMRIVAAVAKAAATDRHWYEPNGKPHERMPVLGAGGRTDALVLNWFGWEQIVDALGASTRVSAPNLAGWRTKAKKPGKPLPSNYRALLLSDQHSAARWNSVADDWHCPTCGRSKDEVVYIEKKGNVSMHLHEVRSQAPRWKQVSFICNHCVSTLMSLKWELGALRDDERDIYRLVTPAELGAIIVPRPHSAHQVDARLAEALLHRILDE